MRAHGPEHGTNQLSGRIVDAETNQGIAYAVIQIEGTTLGTATDTAGFYSLSRLPESRPITAVASAVGYDRQKQTVAIIAGQQTRLDFKLRSTAIMEQIVVHGRPSGHQAYRSAYRRQRTLVETVRSNLLGQYSRRARIRFRPAHGIYLLELRNFADPDQRAGRPVFADSARQPPRIQLAGSGLRSRTTAAGMVDRVEVIRGGGSALYGSNAIAGVVNIITKEPHRNSVSLANTTGFTESGTADVNTSLNASMLSDDRRREPTCSHRSATATTTTATTTVSRIFRRSPRRLPASAPITRQEPIPN